MRKFTCLSIICLSLLGSAFAQQNSVVLNGTDQFIELSDRIDIGSSNFTFEVWVKPTTTSPNIVFGQDINGDADNQFRLSTLNSDAEFTLSGPSPGPVLQISTSSDNVPLNVWTHISVIRNGNTVSIYTNGVLRVNGSAAGIDNQSYAETDKRFRIGARGGVLQPNGDGDNFNGEVDEFRYWSTVRTGQELKSNIFSISNSTTGLQIRLPLDEGSGTTAANTSTVGSSVSGSLINTPSWAASPVRATPNSLDFDGTNDRVAIFDPFTPGGSFTKEAWIYPTSVTGVRDIVSSASHRLLLNGSTLQAGLAGTSNLVVDPTPIAINTWYHVALTFDDATNTMVLYRNGVAVATNNAVATSYTAETNYIGSREGTSAYFQGQIDEVRTWNEARSSTDVTTYYSTEIDPAAFPTLTHYYRFNQGYTGGTNTGLVRVIDQKGDLNGLLETFALTGATSNYAPQYVSILLPVRWNSFEAVLQEAEVRLSWSTSLEENTRDFEVEHSTDGKSWISIGRVPAAVNSGSLTNYAYVHRNPADGKNYYRIRQNDLNGKFSYSGTRVVIAGAASEAFQVRTTLITNATIDIQVSRPVTLSVYDVNGRVWLTQQLNTGRRLLNVPSLPRGVYFIRGEQTVKRFVIQ